MSSPASVNRTRIKISLSAVLIAAAGFILLRRTEGIRSVTAVELERDVIAECPMDEVLAERRAPMASMTRDIFHHPNAPEAKVQRPAVSMSEVEADAVEAITLQAVMVSDPPRALINGQVYTAGDMIGRFRLVHIMARGIVVERDGVQVRVSL